MTTAFTDTIIHGDCLAVLPRIATGSVDFILTDPPYIAPYKPSKNNSGQSVRNNDNATWLEDSFAQMYRVLKPNACAISFYGWPKIALFAYAWRRAGFRTGGHIVFRKQYASQSAYVQYRHESAYVLLKGKPRLPEAPVSDVQEWTYTANKLHPTQKSVHVLTPLIESFTRPGDIVLDPFAGSGSTCIAATHLGRRTIGIEIDEEHHLMASRRLAAHLAKAGAPVPAGSPSGGLEIPHAR
jgi:adenine-specific DNA-methyltransferase